MWKLRDGLAFCIVQRLVEQIILWHPCSIRLLVNLPGQSPDVDSYNGNLLLWDPAAGMFASSSCPVGNIGSTWPRLASCRNQTLGWILDAFMQGNVCENCAHEQGKQCVGNCQFHSADLLIALHVAKECKRFKRWNMVSTGFTSNYSISQTSDLSESWTLVMVQDSWIHQTNHIALGVGKAVSLDLRI